MSTLHAQRRVLPPGAAVLGQVVDAHTGRGIDRVVVEIDGAGLRRRLLTDNRGRFLLTGLPEGEYQLTALRNGYLNGAYGQRRAAGDRSTITLAAGQWMNNVDISLWRPAVLTGYVTDDVGSPIIGVTVRAYRHDRRAGHAALREAGRAVTDDTGAYRLSGLNPGEHLIGISTQRLPDQNPDQNPDQSADQISLEVDDIVFAPMYFPGVELAASAAIMIAEAGRDIAGINFLVRTAAPRDVTGRVDPLSVPDGRMSAVRLVLARPMDPYVAEAPVHRIVTGATPDPDGHFTFRDVPPGEFVIEALLPGGRPESPAPGEPPASGPGMYWAHQTVSVGPGNDEPVTVSLLPGITVEGRTRVVSSNSRTPPPALKLALDFQPLFEVPGVRPFFIGTTAEGAFHTGEALVPGRYRVHVAGIPQGWQLRAVTSGGVDVSDEALDLSSGYPPQDLTIELTDQLTLITGTVRGAGPLADATTTVLLFPQGRRGLSARRYHSARTNNAGTFAFPNIPAGSYLIVAVDESETGGWQAPDRLQLLAARATPVQIREGEAKVLELRHVRAR